MFLADVDILKRVSKKEIVIKPFLKEQVQPAGYDLRLHANFRVFRTTTTTHIDVKKPFEVTEVVKIAKGEAFVIHPREFVLAATMERVTLPNNVVGILEGRSSLGRLGVIMHATAGLVSPGFCGQITFEISNISPLPVKLYPGMRVAQMAFGQLTSAAIRKYGKKGGNKYQYQDAPTPSRIWEDFGVS